MLKFLSIENFALIDRLEIEFSRGLNLITGETGSGKSILVDAVGLLLGTRASQEMLRHGFEKARVEGIFQLSDGNPARKILEAAGIVMDSDEVIVRREISRAGNNKIFVNNVLSTLSLLSSAGSFLVDIHGQHEQQEILRSPVQLAFLDAFLEDPGLLHQVNEAFDAWDSLRKELSQLQEDEQARLQRQDMLKFQIEEIDRLELRLGLGATLEEECQLLRSAEKRFNSAEQAYQLLYGQEDSALELVRSSEKSLEELSSLDSKSESLKQRLTEIRFSLEDCAFDLRDYSGTVEVNPIRLEQIEERLMEIQKVGRKYGESVEAILSHRDSIGAELDHLIEHDSRAAGLATKESALREEFSLQAQKLSQKRKEKATALSRRVERELAELNMEGVAFAAHLETCPDKPSGRGIDHVEFLISANQGEESKPLSRIASGGELSRTVLALKSILTLEDYSKTLVFDEVDTGVGGQVASRVGERLAHLAKEHQVFCVTHLPQVACFAENHFRVDKRDSRGRTVIQISPLSQEHRVEELARMLAGRTLTETTRQQAKELMEQGRAVSGAP